jgi:hypothetical protein
LQSSHVAKRLTAMRQLEQMLDFAASERRCRKAVKEASLRAEREWHRLAINEA